MVQMRTLKLRAKRSFCQGHEAEEWLSLDSNPRQPEPFRKVCLLSPTNLAQETQLPGSESPGRDSTQVWMPLTLMSGVLRDFTVDGFYFPCQVGGQSLS